jgi:protein SCO1/2
MHQVYLRQVRLALWGAAGLAALSLGGVYLWHAAVPPSVPQARITGEADIRSDFSLTDHNGRRVTEADFAGRWQLVFFGFTHCPDICPTTLAYMARVLEHLGGEAERIAPIFITVDPARDTQQVMANYVVAFHPRLIGLTGTEAEVAAAVKAFRVYYERMNEEDAPGGYLMAHSGYIYLMTEKGRFEAVFKESRQPPEEMAREILDRMEKETA